MPNQRLPFCVNKFATLLAFFTASSHIFWLSSCDILLSPFSYLSANFDANPVSSMATVSATMCSICLDFSSGLIDNISHAVFLHPSMTSWVSLTGVKPNFFSISLKAIPAVTPAIRIVAGPWRRFFARIIDMWTLGIILGFAISYAIASQSTAFALWIGVVSENGK